MVLCVSIGDTLYARIDTTHVDNPCDPVLFLCVTKQGKGLLSDSEYPVDVQVHDLRIPELELVSGDKLLPGREGKVLPRDSPCRMLGRGIHRAAHPSWHPSC
jgi:hypothetical protein